MTPASPSKVGVKSCIFTDHARERTLNTEIFYPVEEDAPSQLVENVWKRAPEARNAPIVAQPATLPLLVMSHGDGGSKLDSTWLLERLASQGFIAVAIEHYGNTWDNHLPKESLIRWDRPRDVSFIISAMLTDPFFGKKIDAQRIGFMGFSLGGLTGIWLAGGVANLYKKPLQISSPSVELHPRSNQAIIEEIDFSPAKNTFYDSRIKAAFLMAPGYGSSFDKTGLENIKIPVYVITGEGDEVVGAVSNAVHYAQNITAAALKILPGKVGHYVFLNLPTEMGKKFINRRYSQDDPSVDRAAQHAVIGQAALQFFKNHL